MRPGRSAFTVVEVLVVVGVLAVIMSLVVAGVASVRGNAKRARTLSALRHHASIFTMYAGDHQDRMPQVGDPKVPMGPVSSASQTTKPIAYFLGTDFWNIALADEYYNGRFTGKDFQTREDLLGAAFTNLSYSASFLAKPVFWNELTRTGPEQWGSPKLSEVEYAAKKVVLFDARELLGYEQPWYPPPPPLPDPSNPDPPVIIPQTGLPPYHHYLDPRGKNDVVSAAASIDGSAKNIRRVDYRDPYFTGEGQYPGSWHPGGIPMHHTIDGARGMDLR